MDLQAIIDELKARITGKPLPVLGGQRGGAYAENRVTGQPQVFYPYDDSGIYGYTAHGVPSSYYAREEYKKNPGRRGDLAKLIENWDKERAGYNPALIKNLTDEQLRALKPDEQGLYREQNNAYGPKYIVYPDAAQHEALHDVWFRSLDKINDRQIKDLYNAASQYNSPYSSTQPNDPFIRLTEAIGWGSSDEKSPIIDEYVRVLNETGQADLAQKVRKLVDQAKKKRELTVQNNNEAMYNRQRQVGLNVGWPAWGQ